MRTIRSRGIYTVETMQSPMTHFGRIIIGILSWLPVGRSKEYLPRYKLSNPIGYIAAVLGMPKKLSIGPESLTKQAV
jgi:hypothetical protein